MTTAMRDAVSPTSSSAKDPLTGNARNHQSTAIPLACPLTTRKEPRMITHDARWSLSRGKNPVPSPWQATLSHCSIEGIEDRTA